MAHYLICYDIANPRRLGRVHRCAVRHALFVQYSVYYLHGSKQQLAALLDEISAEIDNAEDDVRAYTIAPLQDATLIGRSWLPPEILLA